MLWTFWLTSIKFHKGLRWWVSWDLRPVAVVHRRPRPWWQTLESPHKGDPWRVRMLGSWHNKCQSSASNFLSVQLHRRSHTALVPGLGRRGKGKGLLLWNSSREGQRLWRAVLWCSFCYRCCGTAAGWVRFVFLALWTARSDGEVWRMDGDQVQVPLTCGCFPAYSLSVPYNFSLDLMDTPCRGGLACQQR